MTAKKISVLFLLFSLNLGTVNGRLDCSLFTNSCQLCIKVNHCYWCGRGEEGRCKDYTNGDVAQLECEDSWNKQQCPKHAAGYDTETSKLNRMLEIIMQLQAANKVVTKPPTTTAAPTTISSSRVSTLKELLNKLLLLRLLRKAQSGEKSEEEVSEEKEVENQYLSRLVDILEKLKKDSQDSVDSVALLEQTALKAARTLPTAIVAAITHSSSQSKQSKLAFTSKAPEIKKATSKQEIKATELSSPPKSATTVKSYTTRPKPADRSEESGLDYEQEVSGLDLWGTSVTKTSESSKGKPAKAPGKSSVDHSFCDVYELQDVCNNDGNCTWCNNGDVCIGRNDDEYSSCIANKKRISVNYGIDQCLEYRQCSMCVANDKCYWCETSKTCHAYPFFGYVPSSCNAGDWYIKQCDIQLAVVVVILPLFIVLLALATFYFCLKYCYYRKKILRVPLFEKPGIFDYRKNKKVYFVNPNEEGDDELKSEQLRKKYRLPLEREPLIDPNT